MSRKLRVGGLVAVVAAVAGIAVASTSAGSSSSGHGSEHVIRVTAETLQRTQIDLGDEGFSQGDQIVFSDEVFQHGKKVGQLHGVCTAQRVLAGHEPIFQCGSTLSLPRGQLTIRGAAAFDEPFTLALTGGTGDYRTAHGQVRIEILSGTEVRLTLFVVR
jgi:hypothetical protein